MDVARIRREFPIFDRRVHDRPLVYLDSAATAQKPRVVIEAEAEFYRTSNANVHRGVHALSEEATDRYEHAREHVARFLHAPSAEEVVFTRGTTESINLVASSLGRLLLRRGDRVIVTLLEHHSNIVPWQMLRESIGIDLQFVEVRPDGRLDLEQYRSLLSPTTKVVSLGHVSNVLGTVNPIAEMAALAHEREVVVVVDAAQSAPHRPVDVGALGADLLAFSGHKALGPTGIGALWGRAELLARMPPYMGGGEMIREVHQDRVLYREPPARFEAGTPNIAGAIGLDAALGFLEGIGFEDIMAHESELAALAYRLAAERFPGFMRIYGPEPGPDRDAILAFSLAGIHPHDVASLLDADGVAVRSGHHCAQPLMEHLGVPALTRASCYLYTLPGEVEQLFVSLSRVKQLFVPATARAPSAASASRAGRRPI